MQSAILIVPDQDVLQRSEIQLTEGHESDTTVTEGEERGTKHSVYLRFKTVN